MEVRGDDAQGIGFLDGFMCLPGHTLGERFAIITFLSFPGEVNYMEMRSFVWRGLTLFFDGAMFKHICDVCFWE